MLALPSLRQLRYLTVLAGRMNFSRAAEDCFVTQSTLSTGIRELESTLGARLVERDRQSVHLTPVGAEVVIRATRLLAEAEDLATYAAGAGKPFTGLIRLGAIPTIAPFLLPELVPLLRKALPGVRLALREDLSASLIDALDAGRLDLALIATPWETGDLLVREIFRDELWLTGPAGDALLREKDIRLGAEAAGRLLFLEGGHCLRDHALAACRRKPDLEEGIAATSLLTLLQMVDSDFGLALIPEMAIKSGLLRGTGLVARPLAEPHPSRGIALAARKTTSRRAEFDVIAEKIEHLHRSAIAASHPAGSRRVPRTRR